MTSPPRHDARSTWTRVAPPLVGLVLGCGGTPSAPPHGDTPVENEPEADGDETRGSSMDPPFDVTGDPNPTDPVDSTSPSDSSGPPDDPTGPADSSSGDPGPESCRPFTIDPLELELQVSRLSGAMPVELDAGTVTIDERSSAQGRSRTRELLRRDYESIGFTVSTHDYGSGVNLIAEREGTGDDPRWVLLTAHYDSAGPIAGADDDATGVVSSLAVATALSRCEMRHSLRVVAFDQEELGLVGSSAYVESLAGSGALDEIIGVINIEMTGYDSNDDGHFDIIDCDRADGQPLVDALGQGLAQVARPLEAVHGCTQASDHASFWDVGVPAVVISQLFFAPAPDRNPCYHQACDTIANLNFEYMADLTAVLTAMTATTVEVTP